ncbi:ArsR/SmtB family transcription factor [Bacillus sp. S14(2024)]|uniref:ArsR/SmtB family transcription factor n=1 Tax=Bacillus sp. S14(2024) TaxID=3162884 RepID=UPI003D25334C
MKWKKQTIELMKLLSDPRRNQILHLAASEPVTVKYLAEQMGEDPLRLYYHVKKLVKAELLEVVETRQQNNFIEKYYQSVNFTDVVYQGNIEEQAEHLELTLASVHRRLNPGLKLYQRSLEKVQEDKQSGKTFHYLPYNVSINSTSERMTTREWRKSIEPIMKAMGTEKNDEPWPEILPSEDDDKEGTYQYILITYKIEDAEMLDLIESNEGENE